MPDLVFMQIPTGVNKFICEYLIMHTTYDIILLQLAVCFYRFLIFPNMGRSLQSVMEEEDDLLSEKVVLQMACRIVSVNLYC